MFCLGIFLLPVLTIMPVLQRQLHWSCTSSPTPKFPEVCEQGGSPHITGIAKRNGDIKLYITHGLKSTQITFLCSLSRKPPELCIKIDAKVNVGFGALYILETSVGMRGKSKPMRSVSRTRQKKHQAWIWWGLQTNISPFEHLLAPLKWPWTLVGWSEC